MDKGIRPYACRRFIELLPARAGSADRLVNLQWRKSLLAELIEQFDITVASASTHYNHAFIEARKLAQQPGNEALAAQLVGLGRPEDKKGGRKKKAQPAEAAAPGTEVEETPTTEVALPDAEEFAELRYSVYRKKDDELVAQDLTREEADALIEKARAAKKAALYLESQTA